MANEITQDLFTRIQNSINAKHSSLKVFKIKQYKSILNILYKEGYIKGFNMHLKFITIYLKYINESSPINKITKVSTINQRKYISYKDINFHSKKYNNRGIIIISTNKGILSNKEAIKEKVGGEILYQIF